MIVIHHIIHYFLKDGFQREDAQIQLTMNWSYMKESLLENLKMMIAIWKIMEYYIGNLYQIDFQFLVGWHVTILLFNLQVLLVKEHFLKLVL